MNSIAEFLVRQGLSLELKSLPRSTMRLEYETPGTSAADRFDGKYIIKHLDLRHAQPIETSDWMVVAALLDHAMKDARDYVEACLMLTRAKFHGPYVVLKPGGTYESRPVEDGPIIMEIFTPALTISSLVFQITPDVVRIVILPNGKVVPQVRRDMGNKCGVIRKVEP